MNRSRPSAPLLLLGAGVSQLGVIARASELGTALVAVDGNPRAVGLGLVSAGEAVDFMDVASVVDVGRRHGVAGVLTVCSDRAVPLVARVAEALHLPGIGEEVALAMTNKLRMRERLEAAGVPQPAFAGARSVEDVRVAASKLGLPLVVKPCDSGGQRGVTCVTALVDLEAAAERALEASASGEVIVERFHTGRELNGILVARGGKVKVITLSDRLQPPGRGFGVGWIHLYPAALSMEERRQAERVATSAVSALGLEDGVGFPQLLVCDDGHVRVVEVAARIPAGQMADLVRFSVGVDLYEIALLQAAGKPVPDRLVEARHEQPLAVRFLTAAPGPLPVGRVNGIGGLDAVQAHPNVLAAGLYFDVGAQIRPVEVDEDRLGFVIAAGEDPQVALRAADEAALLLRIETTDTGIDSV